jgi:fucose 4-O-acetylase-like acetyltransferase
VNTPRPRDESVDALRAATTMLVVFHHTAITYGGGGEWYYDEIRPSANLSSILLSLFTATNQAWFMGLFFLLAGYFTPGAVTRHGAGGYLRERALRLGLPLLVYALLLGPVTIALAQTANGHGFFEVLLWFWSHRYFEVGPPWFVEALLIFALGYLIARAFRPPGPVPSFPANSGLLAAILAIGVANFLVRFVWPLGTNVLGMQLGYFPAYILLFAWGCAASAWPSLDAAPRSTRRLWGWVALVTLPTVPVFALTWLHVMGKGANFGGGLNLPSLLYAFWEPFLACGILLALLHAFHMRFSQLGAFGRAMARRAYTVYLIHPPFVVGIALLWRAVSAPALIKFVVTGSIAAAACWLFAGLMLKLPGARRVL